MGRRSRQTRVVRGVCQGIGEGEGGEMCLPAALYNINWFSPARRSCLAAGHEWVSRSVIRGTAKARTPTDRIARWVFFSSLS